MKKSNNTGFLRSITVLASGSIIAQIITVLTAPFITRIFAPSDIGLYTYILSVSHLFMSIINGRYDMSIVTEEKEDRMFALIKLSFIVSLLFSMIVSILYSFYLKKYNKGYIPYQYLSLILFVLIFSYGVINILNAFNNRNKEYKLMSSLHIIRAACQNFGAIFLGIFNIGIIGLIFPYAIGQVLGLRKQAKSLKPYYNRIKKINFKEMKKVAIAHIKQPLFSAPALFMNNFSYSSITFFIEALFGMSYVGYYSISVRVLGLPLSIVSGNVSRVFFEEASSEYNKTGQFYNSFKKTSIFLSILAIPMLLIMIYIIPSATVLIFGQGWRGAGEYIKVLSIMFTIRFVVSSLSPGILVAKKQNYELVFQIVFVIVSVLCYIISKFLSLSIYWYLISINLTFSIIYIMYFIFIYNCSKINKVKEI